MYWTSSSGRIELKLTLAEARSVSHPGPCDLDVRDLRKRPAVIRQLSKIEPAELAGELKEYGAWDAIELADHDANLSRLVWIAGGNICDEYVTSHRKR